MKGAEFLRRLENRRRFAAFEWLTKAAKVRAVMAVSISAPSIRR